jgi:phospholipid/cholesterol/gamma-HCH transport system substrate-binding protein
MNRETYDLWVGLFVVIGILSIFYLALFVSGYSPAGKETYYQIEAEFDNIGGLKPNAPVKSAGVTVGYVRGIRLDQRSYMATVTVNIRSSFQFPEDSTMAILTSGLLGEQYIGIEAGAEEAMLKDGDQIVKAQSAIVLEKLIGQFLVNFAMKD